MWPPHSSVRRPRSAAAVARKPRRREHGSPPAKLKDPETDYPATDGSSVLTLRGSLTPASRLQYAHVRAGTPLSGEDAWQHAVEFLFERLVVRWELAGAPLTRQRELLQRFRAASTPERAWVRDVLRRHCVENFPDVDAP